MPNDDHSTARQALFDRLAATLDEIPGIVVEKLSSQGSSGSLEPQVHLDISVRGKRLTLQTDFKREVFPAQAREFLWRHKDQRLNTKGPIPVVLALAVTAAARDLLKTEGLGFFDGTGTLFLPAPGAFVLIDKGLPKPRATGERKLFAQRRSQAVHALLREPSRWTGVHQLANEAEVSPATASEVLGLLDKLEWVAARGMGPAKERRLTEPGLLLDAWANAFIAAKREPLQRYFVPRLPTQGPDLMIAEALESAHVSYAISHDGAAQRMAPFLTAINKVRLRAVGGTALEAALSALNAQRVDAGWNLGLWSCDVTHLQFGERIGSAQYASPIHVYLDLLQSIEGRSREMAAHLRQTRLGF